jgi:hypothetical protein
VAAALTSHATNEARLVGAMAEIGLGLDATAVRKLLRRHAYDVQQAVLAALS